MRIKITHLHRTIPCFKVGKFNLVKELNQCFDKRYCDFHVAMFNGLNTLLNYCKATCIRYEYFIKGEHIVLLGKMYSSHIFFMFPLFSWLIVVRVFAYLSAIKPKIMKCHRLVCYRRINLCWWINLCVSELIINFQKWKTVTKIFYP